MINYQHGPRAEVVKSVNTRQRICWIYITETDSKYITVADTNEINTVYVHQIHCLLQLIVVNTHNE